MRTAFVFLSVACCAALLAGCGTAAQSTAGQPSPVPVATATPAPTPTATPAPTPTPEPTPTPGPQVETIDGVTYVNGILIANKTYSLPSTYAPGVDPTAQAAFDKMAADAAAQGLNIYISSAFRSYEYQDGLYNRYVAKDGQELADTYSARPGHSEHQTGLAFDLNTIDDSFANTAEGQWVAAHAHEYGFIVRYPADKVDITGYQYEPWHIRYLGDEAAAVYESGLCLEEYLGITSVYAD